MNRTKEPIKINSLKDFPYLNMSLGDMGWNKTGSWRYLRPRYISKVPACQAACPTNEPIEEWIYALQEKNFEYALFKLMYENPFPGVTGRVCFHPCEMGCNRLSHDAAVSINMLERVVADKGGYEKLPAKFVDKEKDKKIAVIGSGPASMTCAYYLAMLGYQVTMFEKMPKAGGILRYGIPQYRLPKEILDKEIEKLTKLGVEIKTNFEVNKDNFSNIKGEYDAVFLGIGAHRSREMGIPGEKSKNVMPGLVFLEKVGLGEKIDLSGKKIGVIGGGNTAIDTARTALRLNAAEVTVFYRRSEQEMPAFHEEVEAARSEGVKFEFLVTPVKIETSDDESIKSVVMQKMKLGEPDESGRRKPVPIEGSEYDVNLDFVFTAIGEVVDEGVVPDTVEFEWGAITTGKFGETKDEKVFAGGDVTTANRTVVDAIACGKKSAMAIDSYLEGRNLNEVYDNVRVSNTSGMSMAKYVAIYYQNRVPKIHPEPDAVINETIRYESLNKFYFPKMKRTEYPSIPVSERIGGNDNFKEVHIAPDEETYMYEASRCFHCGSCIECDNCYIFCPDVAILKNKDGGYTINYDYCKGCGICVHECPRGAMEMIEEKTEIKGLLR